MALTSTYTVSGLTCEHCVAAVTSEIKALDGVSDVAVALVPGGHSTVTVTSSTEVSPEALAEALDEAGDYRLVTS
ncbi:heavy metal-associated domain-containing protein [Actinopolymorpha sp. NPDC004070]|uniref:heavy-metal-associated domain-containing protein n=1 Tax=Actinopolymorpha sp. NPDC004070 TaxID=3154548 RepID=UPI0033B42690